MILSALLAEYLRATAKATEARDALNADRNAATEADWSRYYVLAGHASALSRSLLAELTQRPALVELVAAAERRAAAQSTEERAEAIGAMERAAQKIVLR